MTPFIVVVDEIEDVKNELLVEDGMIFAKTCSRLRPSRPDGDFRTQVAKDARLKLKQAETKRRMAKPAARIALSTAEPDVATAKRAVENAERSLVTVVTTVEDDRKS